MNKRSKWIISIGSAILVVSLIFNWVTFRTIRGFTAGAQGDLMLGWGTIRQANQDYKNGDKTNAVIDTATGVGYLKASSRVMNQLGVNGIMGLAMYTDYAMTYLLGHSSSQTEEDQHYEHVINVFNNAFMPFGNTNYGSINDRQLHKAVSNVYEAMTPQERNQYQGWGP